MNNLSLDGQVAIVTGAGNGLGRSHALALAARGAKVVINDFDGSGNPPPAAQAVVDEIIEAGGSAFAHGASVTDRVAVAALVEQTIAEWGRIDILINNAGILRDRTFAKLDLADYDAVLDVHLTGSVNLSHAVWPHMVRQGYGRILMTTSTSGMYGNFGQANYGAAKAGVVGLMNTLHLEGARHGIRVNALSPTAATQMTANLFDAATLAALDPASVTPAALFLVSPDAPSRTILLAGAGTVARMAIVETEGVYFPPESCTPEQIAAHFDQIATLDTVIEPAEGSVHVRRILERARDAKAGGRA